MRKTVMTAFAFAAIATTSLSQSKTPGTAFGTAEDAIGTVKTATIEYKDLDLASDAGKARLERRVTGAMRYVCTDEIDQITRMPNTAEVARCKASVRAQVNAALPRGQS